MLFQILALVVTLTTSSSTLSDSFPKILDETAMKDGLDGREWVDPCEDFYQYACGTWLEQAVIPGNLSEFKRTNTPMIEAIDINLNKILENFAKGDQTIPSRYAEKLGDIYTSCLNADQKSEEAIQYVKEELEKIKEVESGQDLPKVLAHLHLKGSGAFFNFYSVQSFNDSTKVIGELFQSGFGLENRDYYFNQDEKSQEIRNRYKEFISKIFILLGETAEKSIQISESVFNLELKLVENAHTIAQLKNPSNLNHPTTLEDLENLVPNFDWNIYFQELNGQQYNDLNIAQPEFFAHWNLLLANLKKEDLQNYLIFQFVNPVAGIIGGEFGQAHFSFWNTFLIGQKERMPTWRKCTNSVKTIMGPALEDAYVQTIDGKSIKAKTEEIIFQIKKVFVDNLKDFSKGISSWIDDDTVASAIEKVGLMTNKIGTTNANRTFEDLEISKTNFLLNYLNVAWFEKLHNLNKIGKPFDKSQWKMKAWEVNAVYDRAKNEFFLTFGILQSPRFDLTASDSANLATIGSTIGHELLHGFDNNGSQHDSYGNLKNWWSPQTRENFNQKIKCFVDQANSYRVESVGLNVDGVRTLGENLSDQGSIKLGQMVMDSILSNRPESPPWLGRFSERQQYWLAYAQRWCTKSTPEKLRSQLINDVHPPQEFRVNGVFMNRPEFARDFNCREGARMAPINRCSLW